MRIKKSIVICVLLCQSLIAQQKLIERKQLFDINWKFFLGDTAAAKSKDFKHKSWPHLDLPHDWSVEGSINPRNAMEVREDTFQQVQVGTGRHSRFPQNVKAKTFPFILKVCT
jgi:hypothetical protein